MATDVLRNIRVRIEKAAQKLGAKTVPDWMLEELLDCEEKFYISVNIKIPDPANPLEKIPKKFNAVRVWHRKPDPEDIWKGGLRFHPDVTLSQMEGHAIEMSIKSWIMKLPHGGAKGGIAIDPYAWPKETLEDVTLQFSKRAIRRGIMSPRIDIMAPDMGTDARIMDWIRDYYILSTGDNIIGNGVVTGKSVDKGGILGRKSATGLGMHLALQTFCEAGEIVLPKKRTAIVQGFGNVSSNFCALADEFNISVIGVVDQFGGVYCPTGLDINKMSEFAFAKTNKYKTINGSECVSPTYIKASFDELMTIGADLFVPAAMEEVITTTVAPKMNFKVVLEGANGPTLADADEILSQRGIKVIPDIYANSGGVTVSYFEWARNTRRFHSDPRICIPENDETSVKTALQTMFRSNGLELIQTAKKYKIPYREAGYALAIERVSPDIKASNRMD
ncbi:MAG: Glu/Leu/Phe/Val dehydrogenase dimerization domain-containing protein [Candidatus Liptonbacteria bacterium]|nr:Glu/Leu/Phe/Val dehydrogenase dimerization domain-containing protein [Candidatus Liptonbacteria bacterium]